MYNQTVYSVAGLLHTYVQMYNQIVNSVAGLFHAKYKVPVQPDSLQYGWPGSYQVQMYSTTRQFTCWLACCILSTNVQP